jgi:hypothetical protein
MDPTTAALIGAAIAGGASVIAGTLGPWVLARINRRAELERERRRDQRREIALVLEAFTDLIRSRHVRRRDEEFFRLFNAAGIAANRLLLLVPDRDHDELQHVLSFTHETVSDSTRGAILEVSMRSASMVLDEWYRGKIKGKKIGDEYGRLINELASRSEN